MYTLCTADTLRESYYRHDKQGKESLDKRGNAPCPSFGISDGVVAKSSAENSSAAPITTSPHEPWRCVVLKDNDASVIVKEFDMPFDATEKNRSAQKGETIKPISADTAAVIKFASMEEKRVESSDPTPPKSDDVHAHPDAPQWHYRYRINKRGRCVIETNAEMDAYWEGLYGGGGSGASSGVTSIVIGGDAVVPHANPAKASTTSKHMQREIVVFYNKGGAVSKRAASSCTTSPIPASDVSAVDLNCYHIGYPIDMGDIEDLAVCAIGNGEGDEEDEDANCNEDSNASAPSRRRAPTHITTINCPLHNRIFDISSGDIIRLDYSSAFASCVLSDETETLLKVTSGKWKNGVVQRDPCRQRVHTVTLQEGTGRIVIHDSYFAHSQAANDRSLPNTTSSSGGPFATAFSSDKYNTFGDTSVAGRR